MRRHAIAITCMAGGVLAVMSAALLALGVPAALAVLGLALIALSLLLGWS